MDCCKMVRMLRMNVKLVDDVVSKIFEYVKNNKK